MPAGRHHRGPAAGGAGGADPLPLAPRLPAGPLPAGVQPLQANVAQHELRGHRGCDCIKTAGPAAAALSGIHIAAMAEAEVADCLDTLGKLV